MSAEPTTRQTRQSNASAHPGALDVPRSKRSTEEIQGEVTAKVNAKEAGKAARASTKIKLSELEAKLRNEQDEVKKNAAHPKTTKQTFIVKMPQPVPTPAKMAVLKTAKDKKAVANKAAKAKKAEKAAATKASNKTNKVTPVEQEEPSSEEEAIQVYESEDSEETELFLPSLSSDPDRPIPEVLPGSKRGYYGGKYQPDDFNIGLQAVPPLDISKRLVALSKRSDLPSAHMKRKAADEIKDEKLQLKKARKLSSESKAPTRPKRSGLIPGWRDAVRGSPSNPSLAASSSFDSRDFGNESESEQVGAGPSSRKAPRGTSRKTSEMAVQITHQNIGNDSSEIEDYDYEVKSPRKARSRKVLGVGDLPTEFRDTYTKLVTPRYVEQIGHSTNPWFSPECRVMQMIFDSSYDEIDCEIARDTAPYDVAKSAASNYRHDVARIAIETVDADIADYLIIMQSHADRAYQRGLTDKHVISGKKDVKAYVESMIIEPERPFLWVTNEETNVPDPKERSGYVTVRSGLYQTEAILKVFAIFYSKGTRSSPPTGLPLTNEELPIGALALACTAVERAWHRHATGVVPEGPDKFEASKWEATTRRYARTIGGMKRSRWVGVFNAVACYTSKQQRRANVRRGPEPVEDEDMYVMPESDDFPPTPSQ